jgi:hypothetical protein
MAVDGWTYLSLTIRIRPTHEGESRASTQRRSNWKQFFAEPEQTSSDMHEDYGGVHHETFKTIMDNAEEESVFSATKNRVGDQRLLKSQIVQALSELLLEKPVDSSWAREDQPRLLRGMSTTNPRSGMKSASQNGGNDGFEDPHIIPEL